MRPTGLAGGYISSQGVGVKYQVSGGVKFQVSSVKQSNPHPASVRSLPLGRFSAQPPLGTPHVSRFIAYIAVAIVLLYFAFRPPSFFDVRLTPYKSLSQALLYPGSEVIFRQWNAFSRVDVIRSNGVRSAPGLSFAYSGELPPNWACWLTVTIYHRFLSPSNQFLLNTCPWP